MKKILYLAFILLYLSLKAQLIAPYAENFENFNFHQNNNIDLDVNAHQPVCSNNVDVDITGGLGYSWNLANTYSINGKALKLTVHEHDHVKEAFHPRSRSEVAFLIDNSSVKYYSYRIYIPNNSEFTENMIADSYHIIQQLQSSMWNRELNQPYNLTRTNSQGDIVNTSNMLGALVYYYSTSSANLKDLEFWANDPKDSKAYSLGEIDEATYMRSRKVMKIRQGFEKGAWNEIIIKVNWSSDNQEAFYQLWINRKPIVLNYQVGGYPWYEYEVLPGLINEEPFKLYAGNVTMTNDNLPLKTPSIIKLGHYRNEHDNVQSIYIDDFRISNDFPPAYLPSNNLSQLIDSQCGSILSIGNLVITAKNVQNAINYRFRFRNQSNLLNMHTINSQGPSVDISNNTFFSTDKSYIVDVSVNNGSFGAQCIITIPYLTKLKQEYCDKTLPLNNWIIEAETLASTTQYKFHFKRIADNVHMWIDKNQPSVNLKDDAGYSGFFKAGASYEVEVANPIHAFGQKCNITLPASTKLTDTYCNQILSHNDMKIYAYQIPDVLNYRFKFTKVDNAGLPYFITSIYPFTDISGLPYFTTGSKYNVEVSIDGGTTYGSICQIETPYLTKLNNDICVNSILTSWTIQANELPFTNQYKFHFKRKDTGDEYWIDKTTPNVTLSDAANYSGYFVAGKTYEVRVAKPIHGYGSKCEITLPSLSNKKLRNFEDEECEDISSLFTHNLK